MQLFHQTLQDCQLNELDFVRGIFTWSNGRRDANFTEEKLDRAVASKCWCDAFGDGEIQVLPTLSSDHCPLLITVMYRQQQVMSFSKISRYEANWSSYDDCCEVGKQMWSSNGPSNGSFSSIMKKLDDQGMHTLRRWSKYKEPVSDVNLQSKLKRLPSLKQSQSAASVGEISILQKDIDALSDRLNMKWKQRAKVHWLQKGDRNTKYFHFCTTQRKKRNCVKSLIDEEGAVFTDSKDIGSVFT
ncbi:hypothetical protein CIPAW_11G000200 [Carya illinoinensis]|uniref:Uncharacterized protein n=1 Tax=Carya illinoinensis TaxID=32201 RepID=A0A8T1NXC7_CARIL|nr:hypothetical protein CIPAW_11G000200 [Carya illinoinensis]